MKTNFAAIIIDICHSRDYNEEERYYIQEKLFSIILFINNHYSKKLIKKFEFSSGDSIQALFKNAADAFSCYFFIKTLFYPYKIRCGIGFDEINKNILNRNYESTNMFDGNAYHLASLALDDCKNDNYNFLFYSPKKEEDKIVNLLIQTVDLLNNDQTDKQADTFNLFNLLYPLEFDGQKKNIEITSYFDYLNSMKESFSLYKSNETKDDIIINLLYNEVFKNDILKNDHANGFPTKMDYICSIILDVTRQNINKHRIAGKFDNIRKLENLVYDFLKERY